MQFRISNFIKSRISQFLKSFLLILLFILMVVGVLGIFIYILYKVAIFSRTLYSIMFYAGLMSFLIYFIFRSIGKKIFSHILLKLLRFLIVIIFFSLILALIMIYGAFVVRYPIIGIAIAPVFLFFMIFIVSKVHISTFFKKYFS